MEQKATETLVRSRLITKDIERINATNENLNLIADKETGELVEVQIAVSESELIIINSHVGLSTYLYSDKEEIAKQERTRLYEIGQNGGH